VSSAPEERKDAIMSDLTTRNDNRLFRWGVIFLVVIGLGVFTPLAWAFGNAPAYFFIEMLLAAGLIAWRYARKRHHK
jgi:hypothetical protein